MWPAIDAKIFAKSVLHLSQRRRSASSRLACPTCDSCSAGWPVPFAGASLAPPVCNPLLGVANQRVLEETLEAVLVSIVREGDMVAFATCRGARHWSSDLSPSQDLHQYAAACSFRHQACQICRRRVLECNPRHHDSKRCVRMAAGAHSEASMCPSHPCSWPIQPEFWAGHRFLLTEVVPDGDSYVIIQK